MLQGVYVMFDKKVGFMTPSFDMNDESAIRNFQYAISKNEFLGVNRSDFELYKIGLYDTQSGQIDSEPTPVFLCNAVPEVKNV